MKKAFSLIEMIVVVSIIGILTAVVIMGVSSYLPSWQLSGSTKLLGSKLRQAQEEAVTTQKLHRINFASVTSPVSYQLIKVDGGDQVIETMEMPNGIDVQLNLNNPVTFSADGGPDYNGSIVLTNSVGSSKTVSISPAGVIIW